MSRTTRQRPHYAYVIVIDGDVKKITTNEMNAYAYLGTLGMKMWSPETQKCILKFDMTTGDRVYGRQRLS